MAPQRVCPPPTCSAHAITCLRTRSRRTSCCARCATARTFATVCARADLTCLVQLLAGVLDERAARKGAKLDAAANAARMDNYCRWNACVLDEFKLGDGGFDKANAEFRKYINDGELRLPEVFQREADPMIVDFPVNLLRPDVERFERRAALHRWSAH